MVSSLCRVVYAVRDKETSCRDLLSDKDYACSYCPLSLMLLLVVTCRGLFSNCLTCLCIKSEAIICDPELSRSWILDIAKDLMKIFMCRVEKYFSWKSDARLSGTPGWLILQLNLRHSWVELMFGVLHTPSSWQVTLSADQPLKHFGLAAVRENEISKKTGMGMAKKEVYDHWKIWNEVEWTRELHLAVSGLTDIIQAICAVLRSLNRAEIQLCW